MKLETKVGAFFIAAIAVMGLLILRMEKLEVFGKSSESKVYTEFDQVAGLNVQSAIRVAGVKVGTVTAIDLDGKRAKVTLSLPKGFQVYQDASAQLGRLTCCGVRVVASPTNGVSAFASQ